MKRTIAVAALALAVAGTTFGLGGTPAFAEMDTQVDQFIVSGQQGLSNIEFTQDSANSTQSSDPTPEPSVPDCTCLELPGEAPAA